MFEGATPPKLTTGSHKLGASRGRKDRGSCIRFRLGVQINPESVTDSFGAIPALALPPAKS
eukprot:2384083-Rhodomonas_salina.1